MKNKKSFGAVSACLLALFLLGSAGCDSHAEQTKTSNKIIRPLGAGRLGQPGATSNALLKEPVFPAPFEADIFIASCFSAD